VQAFLLVGSALQIPNTVSVMKNISKPTGTTALDAFGIVKRQLLEPAGLSFKYLDHALSALMSRRLDYGDLYFQCTQYETWTLEDSIVKDGTHSVDQGVGVRAISGEKTGFAYSDQLDEVALMDAVVAGRAIARVSGKGKVKAPRLAPEGKLYSSLNPLAHLEDDQKVALLTGIDKEVRAMDERIVQVIASLSSAHEVVFVLGSDGTQGADVRPLFRLSVSVIMEQGGRREQGFGGGGGRGDFSAFVSDGAGTRIGQEAVRQASVNLEAVPAPAGNMPVVLGSGWPGILLHEAIGHGLEGDFNRKGTSAFSGRIGDRVATDQCTVVDNGTLEGRRGSLNIDDEGTPTRCNTLIENGVLRGYLHDKLNARLMNTVSTGNGRRESFAHPPMPRMTNTYMLPGKFDPQEIIASVNKGLYAPNFGGGQVDITSGKFVFSASEAYLIEGGKITRPVKGAMLIGSGPEVLQQVSMVGCNFDLDPGVGVCGKDGQSVPVGVGQPTIKVDSLTVGGTATG